MGNTQSLQSEETRKAGAAVVSEPRHREPNGSTPPRPAWDDSLRCHFRHRNSSREPTRHRLQVQSSSPQVKLSPLFHLALKRGEVKSTNCASTFSCRLKLSINNVTIAVTKVLLLSLLPVHTFITSVFLLDRHRVSMGRLRPKMGRPQEIMKQHFLH